MTLLPPFTYVCMRAAPKPLPLASAWISKGNQKFGTVEDPVTEISRFNLTKASSQCSVQLHDTSFRWVIQGFHNLRITVDKFSTPATQSQNLSSDFLSTGLGKLWTASHHDYLQYTQET